jgi:hypothetical protein
MFLPSVCSADVREDTLEDTYSDILENIAENEREVLGTNNTETIIDYFKNKGNMSDFEATVFLDMVAFSTGKKSYFEYIINGTRGISPHDNGVISGFENQLNRFRFANESVRREILYHGGSLSGTIRFVMDCSESSEHMAYSLDCGEEYANEIKAIGVMLEDNPLSLDTDDLENRLDKAVNGWRDEIYTHFMDYAYRINGSDFSSSSSPYNFGIDDSIEAVMAKVNNLSVLKNKIGDVSDDCVRAGAICTGVGGILAPTFGAFDAKKIIQASKAMIAKNMFISNYQYVDLLSSDQVYLASYIGSESICFTSLDAVIKGLNENGIGWRLIENSKGENIFIELFDPKINAFSERFSITYASTTQEYINFMDRGGKISIDTIERLNKASKGASAVDIVLSVIFFVLMVIGIVLTIIGVELLTVGVALEGIEYDLSVITDNLKFIMDLKVV